MADPISASALAAISIGTTIAGGALSAAGAVSQGTQQQAMYNYKAGIAQVNATIDRQNASWALESGGTSALQSGQKTGLTVASQKVAQSGSGIDVNTGSSANVRSSTTEIGQLDQSIIRTNSARKAYGFNVEAASKDAEAAMDITAGANAAKTGDLNAVTSILGTATSVSSKWSQGIQSGMFSSSGAAKGGLDAMGNPT